MMFRRRSSHAADVEAARAAAASVGGYACFYDGPVRVRRWIDQPLTETSPAASIPAAEDAPSCEASARPQLGATNNFPSDVCADCEGHIGWIDRGDHFDGHCYGYGGCGCGAISTRPKGTTIAKTVEHIDALKAENTELQETVATLRSRLYEARVQLDLARDQLADARAIGGAGRMAP
jgi:hypothetical protein